MTYGSNKAHRPADHHPWRSGWVPKPTERERTCIVCGTTKPIGDYAPSGSGRRTVCRECYNAQRREDEATPEGRAHKRAIDRADYQRHPHKKVAANRRCRHKKLAEAGRPIVPVPERWYGTVRASLELDISISWVVRHGAGLVGTGHQYLVGGAAVPVRGTPSGKDGEREARGVVLARRPGQRGGDEEEAEGVGMITISLPIPDRRLSLNGREHWRTVRAGQQAQHLLASLEAQVAIGRVGTPGRATEAPLHPTEFVSVFIDVERKARGNVWDTAGIVEATKGYCDGLEGWVYTDDTQIRSFAVRWDAKPTGNGLIHLYIRALSEPQDWPVVEWATEEWR